MPDCYPFPLVRRPGVRRDRRGLPRYLARRLLEAERHEGLLVEALASLNALESSRASGKMQCVEPRQATTDDEVTPTQNS
eukprot:15562629-Heterocapsa_arctica.AAC.1